MQVLLNQVQITSIPHFTFMDAIAVYISSSFLEKYFPHSHQKEEGARATANYYHVHIFPTQSMQVVDIGGERWTGVSPVWRDEDQGIIF